MKRVQVVRDIGDLIFIPIQSDICLPAAHLNFKAAPIGCKLLLAPMNFRGVACATVCRIEQLTP